MPAMTMVFQVRDRSILDTLKPGDKVKFRAVKDARKYTVTDLALAATAVSAGPLVDIGWDSQSRFQHGTPITPGKFVEACGTLEAGQAVQSSFEASAPLDFNIHYHLGKDVVFPAKQAQVARGRDRPAVALTQDYCWMWTNKGAAPVTLQLQLQR